MGGQLLKLGGGNTVPGNDHWCKSHDVPVALKENQVRRNKTKI